MKKLTLYCLSMLLLPAGLMAQYLGGIGGGYASSTSLAQALPVEIISFTAQTKNNQVQLQWSTATEVNNFGFDIERRVSDLAGTAANDDRWQKIGFVEGAGTSNTPRSYIFGDAQARGKVSYRLKQIDRDGKFEYSQTVEAAISAPGTLTLTQNFPNPFNPSTTISFSVPVDGHATLKIFNMLGQEVATLFNGEMSAEKFNQITFNASGLASGLYFSRLEFDGKMQTKIMTLIK